MTLFPELAPQPRKERTTFRDNNKLPIHNWFKYSAGFSADWVTERLIKNPDVEVVGDPFAGSGTTLISASLTGRDSIGFESHSFVYRVAKAKSAALTVDAEEFRRRSNIFFDSIRDEPITEYILENELLSRIFDNRNLEAISRIRSGLNCLPNDAYSEIIWLAAVSILRSSSHSGTATWQYVLPNKSKARVTDAFDALNLRLLQFYKDIKSVGELQRGNISVSKVDSRNYQTIDNLSCDIIITSPPYANNFDYADATRIEMTFLGEIEKWGDLQGVIRKDIVRSSTQHVSPYKNTAADILRDPLLSPIADELSNIAHRLGEQKKIKTGKKDYDAMIIFYFYDMAKCLTTSRKILKEDGKAYFVIGDSAPYGVHVPVERLLGELALSLGFENWRFAKERDRNTKWKNRKHDHPLKEGFLIIRG